MLLPGKNDQGVEGRIKNVTGIGGARITRNEVEAPRENEVIDGIDEKKKRRRRKGHVSQEKSIESENHIVAAGDAIIIVMGAMDEPQVEVFPGIGIIAVLGTKIQEAGVVLVIVSGESPLMTIRRFSQKRIIVAAV